MENWQCIHVSEGIKKLYDELFIDSDNNNGVKCLEKMLSCLVGNERKWIIVFEPGFDHIDEVITGDLDFAICKIVESLKLQYNGFVLWYEKEVAPDLQTGMH